jgi:hypothetical protein
VAKGLKYVIPEIIARGFSDERLGNHDGRDERWRTAFERIYQHDLETGAKLNA